MPRPKPDRPHKPYDVTFKHLVEAHPLDVLRLVGLSDVRTVKVVDAELSTVVAAADKLLKVNPGKDEYFVHLEFQSGLDSELLDRCFWYSAVAYRRHRCGVLTAIVLLTRTADHARLHEPWRIRLPTGEPTHQFHFQVVRIWERTVDSVMAAGPGMWPLAPLCDEAESRVDAVIDRMKREIRRQSTSEQELLWAATYFMMGLRFEVDQIAALLPGGKAMKESVTYQATIEEGQIKEAKRLILRLGRTKFGEVDSAVRSRLASITELEALEEMSERLLISDSWQTLFGKDPRSKSKKRKT